MKRFVKTMSAMLCIGVAIVVCNAKLAVADLAIAVGDTVYADTYVLHSGTGDGSVSGTPSSSGGVFKWEGNTTGVGDPNDSFYAMCIELTQFAIPPTTYSAVALPGNGPNSAPVSLTVANRIGWLWANVFHPLGSLHVGGIDSPKDLYNLGDNNPSTGALQLATWALVYGAAITDNVVGADPETTLAATYLTAANGAGAAAIAGAHKAVIALVNVLGDPKSGDQDMLIYDPTGVPNSAVPEPATIVIWSLIGGIGAVFGVRRNRRSAKVA